MTSRLVRATAFLRGKVSGVHLASLDARMLRRLERLATQLRCHIVAYDAQRLGEPHPSGYRQLCRMAHAARLNRSSYEQLSRIERTCARPIVLVAYRRPWRLRLPGVWERRSLARHAG